MLKLCSHALYYDLCACIFFPFPFDHAKREISILLRRVKYTLLSTRGSFV